MFASRTQQQELQHETDRCAAEIQSLKTKAAHASWQDKFNYYEKMEELQIQSVAAQAALRRLKRSHIETRTLASSSRQDR